MRTRLPLTVACMAFFMVVLDTTVVNVALPSIEHTLGGGVAGAQWVVDAYTLTFGAFVLSGGHISDRLGASVSLGIGAAGFAVSSALCAIAPSLAVLIAARAAQGAFAAVMLPSSLALVSQTFTEPRARRRAVSIWATAGGAAVAAGPIVGGLLTRGPGWPAVFLINVPIGALALLGLRFVPRSPPRQARLDVFGQVAAVIALTLFAFALIEGGRVGFDQPRIIVGLILFAVAATALVIHGWRSPHAAVPVRLLATKEAGAALCVGFALYFAFYGVIFTLSLYFQQVLNYGPAQAGLMFVPMTVLISVATLASGRWSRATSPFLPMAIGTFAMASGFLALVVIQAHSPVWEVAVATIPIGIGSGIAGPGIPVAILAALPEDRSGTGSGIANALRQVAATTGVGVFGALLAGRAGIAQGMEPACLVAAIALLIGTGAAVSCVCRPPRLAVAPAAA
jgi:MFS transporter, DHA2 family, methylenomycin A resistance protein